MKTKRQVFQVIIDRETEAGKIQDSDILAALEEYSKELKHEYNIQVDERNIGAN